MSDSGRSDETGRIIGDRYQLVAVIGSGGSATVYLADDLEQGRQVALKLFHSVPAGDEEFLRRFRAEARYAAALDDPHILSVIDSGHEESAGRVEPYWVTDYMAGGSLQSLLDAGQLLTISQMLVVGLDAARALDHAHRHGQVHRDLRPANLLFDANGDLRVADFGVGRATSESSGLATSVGSDRYCSPEQLVGQRLGGRSDVYSLSLILAESVIGELPSGESGESDRSSPGDLVLDSEFGPLRTVLERAGRFNADERPDAEELEIALMASAEDLARPEPLQLAPPELSGGNHSAGNTSSGPSVTSAATSDAASTTSAGDALSGGAVLAPPPSLAAGRGDGSDASGPEPAAEPFEHSHRAARIIGIVALLVVLAGAGGWWFLLRTPTHEVPVVTGLSVTEATATGKKLNWRIDDNTLVRKDGTAAGEVVGQSPRAGVQLKEGGTLKLTVSLGSDLVPYPTAIAGAPQDQARTILRDAGLRVGEVALATDEKIPKGSVISATPKVSPDARGEVPGGTLVALVVSEGPAPRTIPGGLVGTPVAAAQAKLAKVQLGSKVSQVFNEKVPAGTVVSVRPEVGVEVPRDAAVGLVVSKGKAPAPFPNVIGKSGTDAFIALTSAGFKVLGISGPSSGRVTASDPPPGKVVPFGSGVRLATVA